jgi:hypothetical protein
MPNDLQTSRPTWTLRARRALYGLSFRLLRHLAIPGPHRHRRPAHRVRSGAGRGSALTANRPGRPVTPTGGSCHVIIPPKRPL